MATELLNPILPGFHPDPCLCRAGSDIYLATSTFEWFPGVCVYHTRDCIHWDLAARPLDRRSLLDLAGVPDSGGVWAPALSWHDGYFWLVYTNMRHFDGAYKDAHNFLISAPTIEGPWSAPAFLNASGFDPSLFHDKDGRKYLLNQRWNPRDPDRRFDGITIQEYHPGQRKLIGQPRLLFAGTSLGVTEGPHLFRHLDRYYLVCAEGGTGWEHAVTIARSDSLDGPWEVHPENPLLTSTHHPDLPLQKAGHASILQLESGDWILAHLCSRPLSVNGERYCPLGRETALQSVVWGDDGWPRMAHGSPTPATTVPLPSTLPGPGQTPDHRNELQTVSFNEEGIPSSLHSLRQPIHAGWADVHQRKGWLRLRGGESLHSRFHQSLLGLRLRHFACSLSTVMEFLPEDYFQAAGLLLYYNTRNWAYLCLTADRSGKALLELQRCRNSSVPAVLHSEALPVPSFAGSLGFSIHDNKVRFAVDPDSPQSPIHRPDFGPVLPFHEFSDDFVEGWGFTGAFAAIACQDLSGQGRSADFQSILYQPSSSS